MTTRTHTTSRTDASDAVLGTIDAFRKDRHIPALSVAIADSTGLRHAHASGVADIRTGRPATPETSYLWFSLTKIVTATAAVRLADEGHLDLNEPLDRYFPMLSRSARSATAPTVGNLLNHTAGLTNPLPLRWVRPAASAATAPSELTERILRRHHRLRSPIGTVARYSNLGYLLLGEIISAVSRQPFESYVRQAILTPLDMDHTGFVHHPDREPATGYVTMPRGLGPAVARLLPPGIVGSQYGRHRALLPFYVEGASYGGLVGDAVDASRIASLHLGDGTYAGRRVISAAAARRMRQITTPGKPFDLGQGWFRSPAHRTGATNHAEHLGAGGGYFNVMRIYPDHGIGIVIMTNTTRRFPHHGLLDELLRIVSLSAA